MKRTLRYLRIAFSATCLIACVLLIVLWVRSYWWADEIDALPFGTHVIDVESLPGWVRVTVYPPQKLGITFGRDYPWGLKTRDIESGWVQNQLAFPHRLFVADAIDDWEIWIPHWLSALFFIVLAPSLWIRWSKRFTLRTLLIATTLVAVVLGLIVWSMRAG